MHHDTAEMTESAADMATDPVCGMKVDIGARGPSFEHRGETYWFCSQGCRTKFAGDPERYLTKKGEAKPLPQGTLYTCPMHPEIVKEGPGHCPICGMALEPMGVPPEITDNPELIDFTRRLTIAVPLSLALLALCLRHRSPPLPLGERQSVAAIADRNPGGAVLRLAVLRARLGFAPLRAAQHVHAHCHGLWRGVSL